MRKNRSNSLLKGMIFFPFALALATVFADSDRLANGTVSAKLIAWSAYHQAIPVIRPFYSYDTVGPSDALVGSLFSVSDGVKLLVESQRILLPFVNSNRPDRSHIGAKTAIRLGHFTSYKNRHH
jgi:hypothetical protein